jgi:hypothetical protein
MAAANRLFNGGLTSKVAKADGKNDSGPPSPVVGMRKAVSGGAAHASAGGQKDFSALTLDADTCSWLPNNRAHSPLSWTSPV